MKLRGGARYWEPIFARSAKNPNLSVRTIKRNLITLYLLKNRWGVGSEKEPHGSGQDQHIYDLTEDIYI